MKPMIYTVQSVMLLMRADALRGQVGGGWVLEIETFLSPVKWHRAVRRVPFGAQKGEISRALKKIAFFGPKWNSGGSKTSRFSGPTPSNGPPKWIFPHQNHT
jgi:hypothetical protein